MSRILIALVLAWSALSPALAADCRKTTCGQMASCAEAFEGLLSCGFRRLDGDGDGVPCEAICGGGGAAFGLLGAAPLARASGGSCAPKTCRQISSCGEAMHLLNDCGLSRLDGDGDGVPCESLC